MGWMAGSTPLSQGLYLALETLESERLRDRDVLPLLVLLSDGRANVAMGSSSPPDPASGRGANAVEETKAIASLVKEKRIPSVVIDTELGFLRFGLARPIAEAMGAQYIELDELRAETLADAVRSRLDPAEQQDLTPEEMHSLATRLGLT